MSNLGQKNPKPRTIRNTPILIWAAWLGFALLTVLTLAMLGAAGGYRAAQNDWQRTQVAGQVFSLAEQYALGLQDVQQGRYDLAQQRFEYILGKEPGFPGAAESLAQVIQIQSATATPTEIPATQTPTPTRDLRPVDTLFSSIQALFAQGDWEGSVNAILALRQADSLYRAPEVDGILYRSLRNRGLLKIREAGNLEGGIYDLTLAERIGPLDVEANTQRDLARYYMMGSSFWEVYPEQAVYYFGLVASAFPSMRDAAGWTAAARYRAALIQLADQLARSGDWCSAQSQYELALSYTNEAALQATVEYAAYQCNPPTDTPLPETETPTLIMTLTATLVDLLSPTPSPTTPATATGLPTATVDITLSPTAQPTIIPTAEGTPTVAPTETPIPTQELSPTPSPSLIPTETVGETDLPTQTSTPEPGTGSSRP